MHKNELRLNWFGFCLNRIGLVSTKNDLVSTDLSFVETKLFGFNRFLVSTKNMGYVRKSIP